MAKSKVKDSDVVAYLQERKQALRDELEKMETMLSVVGASSKETLKKGKKKGKKKLDKAIKAIRKKVAQAIEGAKVKLSSAPAVKPETLAKKANEPKVRKAKALSTKATEKIEAPRGKGSTTQSVKKLSTTTPVSNAPIATEAPAKRTRTRQAAKPAVSSSESIETAPASTKQVPVKKAVTAKAAKERAPATSKAAADKKAAGKTIPASFDPKANMDDKIRFALAHKKNSTKAEVIDYLNSLEPEYGLTKLKKVVAFRLNHLLKTGQVKGQESKLGIRYAN